MAADDDTLARALVHDAHVILSSDTPDNLGREDDLNHVKDAISLADTILSGNATDEQRARVEGFVHPQIRSLFFP
jgi:hypothetical protein